MSASDTYLGGTLIGTMRRLWIDGSEVDAEMDADEASEPERARESGVSVTVVPSTRGGASLGPPLYKLETNRCDSK